MLVDLKIRTTSPMLGGHPGPQQMRQFKRDKDPTYLQVPIREWAWTLREAATSLDFDPLLDTTLVQFPVRFRKPNIVPHKRGYDRNGNVDNHREEVFESVGINNVITFILFLPTEAPFGKMCPPSLNDLERMLKFVGTYIGWSPWGHKWGYGRFNVEVIKETNEADAARFR